MRSFSALLLTALLAVASAQRQQEGYQGFNSGAFKKDYSAKTLEDFEAEFTTAQKLRGSPGLFNSVRLYTNIQHGTTDEPIAAFQAAMNTNTSILLGIWCSGTRSIENELSALKKAIQEHNQALVDLVVGISVGSEDLYRISESGLRNEAGIGAGPNTIVDFIEQTRTFLTENNLSGKPVGHVDTWSAWANSSNSAVVDAVDWIGTDLYPYFEDNVPNPISNATTVFDNAYNATLEAAGDKPVWITETGWPSDGPSFGQAEPSVENAEIYWQTIGCKLFGRVNVWWYNLGDSNPENDAVFAITEGLSTTPRFNLTCSPSSGAPAAVNTGPEPSAGAVTRYSLFTSVAVVAVVGLFTSAI
jgi:glucan endo-1,3-beta-D-glucosidase